MTGKGWVANYREDFYDPAWASAPHTPREAWIDMVMMANWAPGEVSIGGRRVTLQRGQLAWSVARMAKRWGWSPGKVKRHLEFLESSGRIDRLPSHVTSVITITNYDRDQFGGPTASVDQLTGQPTDQLTGQPTSEPTDQLTSRETPDNSRANAAGEQRGESTDESTDRPTIRHANGALGGPQEEEGTNNKQPSPPTPKGERGGWEKIVIEEVKGLGVNLARQAVTAAVARGCTIEDFRGHLAYYNDHCDLWGSPEGVLYDHLTKLEPGQAAAAGWASFDPEKADQAQKQRDEDQKRQRAIDLLKSAEGSGEYQGLRSLAIGVALDHGKDETNEKVIEWYMVKIILDRPWPLCGQKLADAAARLNSSTPRSTAARPPGATAVAATTRSASPAGAA